MPIIPILAAAEGAPAAAITRRDFLAIAPIKAALSATPNPLRANDTAGGPQDPIVDAILAYRRGLHAFSAVRGVDWPLHGGEEALIEKTYGRPMAVLDHWTKAATTRLGAIEALRLAHEDCSDFYAGSLALNMIGAALVFLEQGGDNHDRA